MIPKFKAGDTVFYHNPISTVYNDHSYTEKVWVRALVRKVFEPQESIFYSYEIMTLEEEYSDGVVAEFELKHS